MTVTELHYDFDLKHDRVDSQSTASFNVAEKDWLLNEAEQMIIRSRVRELETSQIRIDDLKTLIITNEVITPTLNTTLSIYELDLSNLSNEYMYFISGLAEIDKANCDNVLANMKFIQHDDLNYTLSDPFNSPDESEVLYNFGRASSDTGSSIYIYPGSETINSLRVNYVKYPSRINFGNYVFIDGITYPSQTSELPEHMHPQIVDLAVRIASGVIQHPEYVQLKNAQVFQNEEH